MSGALSYRTCWQCKIGFGLTPEFERHARAAGRAFTLYCPNGHKASFPNPSDVSEAEKLRKERDRLKQNQAYLEDRLRAEVEHREAAQRQARAFKGVTTRLKNRAAAGVCPCCNRTFSQLQRHMASKHPAFKAEALPGGVTAQ